MTSYNVKKRGDSEASKCQYYVWYLGWKECRGLAGREITEPLVKDLVIRRQNDELPKLTLEISKKEIRVSQQTKSKFGRPEKIKFPTTPAKDVTYAVQALPPDEDVVACIYLGYNPSTRRVVHIHVYKCDSPSTAADLADTLMDIVRLPEHEERIRGIEELLTARGEIIPRPRNFISSFDSSDVSRTPSTVHTRLDDDLDLSDSDSGTPYSREVYGNEEEEDPYRVEKEEKMDNLANELKAKLGNKTKAPLLLPPQDYDTVRRVRGNLDLENFEQYDARKCKNENIVGGVAVQHEEDRAKANSMGQKGSNSGSSDMSSNREQHQDSLDRKNTRRSGSEEGGSRDSGEMNPMSTRWMERDPGYHSRERNRSPKRPSHRILHQTSSDSGYPSGGSREARSPRSPSPPRRSPSPFYYDREGARRGARAHSPRRNEQPRYPDEPEYWMQYPAGRLPPPGMLPPGMMPPPGMIPPGTMPPPVRGDPDYGRLPRQKSLDSYQQPDHYRNDPTNLSASMPASLLQQQMQEIPRKDKKKKKSKKRQTP